MKRLDMNPYDILGIPIGSAPDAVREAYRRLAKACHPDLNPDDPGAAERFHELQAAYRQAMDMPSTPSADQAGEPGLRPRRHVRQRTVYREIVLDLQQALAGAIIRIEGASGLCAPCDGTGRLASKHEVACATCDGSGVQASRTKGFISLQIECHECLGTGSTHTVICHHCGGYGVNSTSPCDVAIPPNVRSGDVFRVEGAASIAAEDIKGDIEFVVEIRDKNFRVVGNDIETQVWIDVWQAARGATVPVRHPDGKVFRLAIPSGCSHGRRFVSKGAGLPPSDDAPAGDLVVIASIRALRSSTPDIEAALSALERAVESSRK